MFPELKITNIPTLLCHFNIFLTDEFIFGHKINLFSGDHLSILFKSKTIWYFILHKNYTIFLINGATCVSFYELFSQCYTLSLMSQLKMSFKWFTIITFNVHSLTDYTTFWFLNKIHGIEKLHMSCHIYINEVVNNT